MNPYTLTLGLALGEAKAEEPKEIPFTDIPIACQEEMNTVRSVTQRSYEFPYISESSSNALIQDGIQTFTFEKRSEHAKEPSTFAFAIRQICSWDEKGNVAYQFEEPSPKERPQNYNGTQSIFTMSATYSPEGPLQSKEITVRLFDEVSWDTDFFKFREMLKDLREGRFSAPQESTDLAIKLASEPQADSTGLLLREYIGGRETPDSHVAYYERTDALAEPGKYTLAKLSFSRGTVLEKLTGQYTLDTAGRVVHLETQRTRRDIPDPFITKTTHNLETSPSAEEKDYLPGIIDVTYTPIGLLDRITIERREPESGKCVRKTEKLFRYINFDYNDENNEYGQPRQYYIETKGFEKGCNGKYVTEKGRLVDIQEDKVINRGYYKDITWNIAELQDILHSFTRLLFEPERVAEFSVGAKIEYYHLHHIEHQKNASNK